MGEKENLAKKRKRFESHMSNSPLIGGDCEIRDLWINGTHINVSEFGDVWVERTFGGVGKIMLARKCGIGSQGYAVTSAGGKVEYVHRLVAMAFDDSFDPALTINHIDGNKLNNFRFNLEQLTRAENVRAYNRPQGGTSQYRGVCKPTEKDYFIARIKHQRKSIHLGCFESEHDAARAYNDKAMELGWPAGCLNKIKEGN